MERNNKEPSISPTPDSDTTGHSVQTIIAKHNGSSYSVQDNKRNGTNNNGFNNNAFNTMTPDVDTNGHLYNTPADILPSSKEKTTYSGANNKPETVTSQNPNVNNASASSSVTLITTPVPNRLPLNVWLGTVQLLLSVVLTALGGLVLARSAALAGTGAGIWSGGICGITGALGVINVRKAQTGFLAVSLICVASSTLAIALTGIGLVRDYNINSISSKGAVSAGSGLLTALAIHFIVSVLSIYYLALKLCLRPNTNDQTIDGIANNSTYLSQQRVEQYFKSLTMDKYKNGYPPIIHRSMLKAFSEKNFNPKNKSPEIWISQTGKQVASPAISNRRIVLVPAGLRNSVSMIPMYGPPTLPPLPPRPLPRPPPPAPLSPGLIYPTLPPGFVPYQPYPMRPFLIENEMALERIRASRQTKDRRSKRARRKSESDIEARKAFTYTGMDRMIAENFLEHQEKCNGSNVDCTSSDEELGKCPDVAM